MPRKPFQFDKPTRKHKKVDPGSFVNLAGQGEADAKPKAKLVFWAMGGHLPLQQVIIPVDKVDFTDKDTPFTFRQKVKHEQLVAGYNHLVIAVTDKNTVSDHIVIRVVGRAAPVKGEPIRAVPQLKIQTLDGGTEFNDIDPDVELVVEGLVGDDPGGLTVYVTLYAFASQKALAVYTAEAPVGADHSFAVKIGEEFLESGHAYTAVATANVEHVPDAVGFYTR